MKTILRSAIGYLLLAIAALGATGCATATRITVRDGARSAQIVMPKNYRASDLDLQLKPDGTLVLKATQLTANASQVIDSTAGAVGQIADTAARVAPALAK